MKLKFTIIGIGILILISISVKARASYFPDPIPTAEWDLIGGGDIRRDIPHWR